MWEARYWSCFRETFIVTTLFFQTHSRPSTRHSVARAMAAVASALETIFDVFAEAGDLGAEARERYPLAD